MTGLQRKFADGSAPTGGSLPVAIAVGDFNGDGRLELVTADQNSNSASVLLGNGDGTFQINVDYAVGSSPTWIAVGDFTGDGKLDLAVTSEGDNIVSILLGNGDGTFRPSIQYPTGVLPKSVAIGDFNGDGKPDLAIANACGESTNCNVLTATGSVSILLGRGDGTFISRVDYPTGFYSDSVAVGDFDGDGRLDLVVANQSNSGLGVGGNSVSILLGNGDGTFQAHVDYPSGDLTYGVAVADFNNDGRLDLSVASLSDGALGILLGNGDGTFQNNVLGRRTIPAGSLKKSPKSAEVENVAVQ